MISTKPSYQRIQRLSPALANQIAAGEVVERPASVLKELLENSIDAGSKNIEITVERSGIGLIRVQDNGEGICKEDLELAILSHATSKIQTLADLEGVVSYGFRGEALASISAVSRLKISACVVEQEFGWCLESMGRDTKPTLSPIPKRQGTCVEVCDLFYNTPARRKFLRSEKTEQSYLEEVFKRIALSQPEITFSLFQKERLQKRLMAAKTEEAQLRRVAVLCGDKFIKESYYIASEANGLKLSGWIGSPKIQRSQADLQYFYVNGRIVRDKVVSHAIRQAYQNFCLPGRFPAYLLYFELDPASVDVNVHPTKHEVRFREARTVHAFLNHSIRESLEQTNRIVEVVPVHLKPEETEDTIQVENISSSKDSMSFFGNPISVLGGEFLLSEKAEEWVVVDIKTTRYLWLRKKIEENYKNEGVASKPLLIPTRVKVGALNNQIESTLEVLKRLGFDLTLSGPDTVLVRSVPFLFGETLLNLEILIHQLVNSSLEVNERIEIIAKHWVDFQPYSIKEGEKLLFELQEYIIKENDNGNKLYRKVNLEQLRAALFQTN